MSRLNAWKKKISEKQDSPKAIDSALKRELKIASGTESYAHRDPVRNVSESFSQTFDMIGMMKAAQYRSGIHERRQESQQSRKTDKNSEKLQGSDGKQGQSWRASDTLTLGRTRMDSRYKPAPGDENEGFVRRFSETAFNRGSMAGAVMRGTGKMMMLSCLSRTADQSKPKNFRQRMLFQSGASVSTNIDGQPGSKVVFNRGEPESAVGLVVDTLQSAKSVVDAMTDIAEGNGTIPKGSGAETVNRMYPFLSDGREQALLARYRELLLELGSSSESAEKRRILERAHRKTEALIEKKQQMRFQFTQQLKFLQNRAESAIEVFDAPAFSQELREKLKDYSAESPPPDDKPDADGVENDMRRDTEKDES